MTYGLPDRIKHLRCQYHLRQDHVAAQIGVSRSTMCAYEAGTRRPTYETPVLLADLYHTTTDYLLGRTVGKTLDLSGLSEEEGDVIAALVVTMIAKNEKIKELA